MTQPNKRDRPPSPCPASPDQERVASEANEANRHLKLGVGLGALGAAAAAVGAFCPLCVVIPPAFIASGLWRHHKRQQETETATATADDASDKLKRAEAAKDGSVA